MSRRSRPSCRAWWCTSTWRRRTASRSTDADRSSVHVRPAEQLLELIVARDDRPLDVPRPPAVPAARELPALHRAHGRRCCGRRARRLAPRCGFGAYFVEGAFEDHWVCEYWDAEQQRWLLVDAQIDAAQRGTSRSTSTSPMCRGDRFLIAGDAWLQCRAGKADPDTFGLSVVKEFGDWWIAGNLMRDIAAFRNVELLPWDVWGAMPGPDDADHRRPERALRRSRPADADARRRVHGIATALRRPTPSASRPRSSTRSAASPKPI